MLFTLFIIFVLIVGLIVAAKILDEKKKKGREVLPEENIGSYFKLRDYFFTNSEKPFFDELVRQVGERYIVLSKVRLEDVVTTAKKLDYKEKGLKRNFIKSKHLDFVLVDKSSGKIVYVFELDGYSHNLEKQAKYDKIKDDILNGVGVKFVRVRVGQDYAAVIRYALETLP